MSETVRERLNTLDMLGITNKIVEEAQDLLSKKEKRVQDDKLPKQSISVDSMPSTRIQKANVCIASNYCKVDLDIFDKALEQMNVQEQIVYLRLYRLSWGYDKNWCLVGYGKLMKYCHLARNVVIRAVKGLIGKGWIDEMDFSNTKGTTYRIYLPFEKGFESKTTIKTIPSTSIPPQSIPIESIAGIPSTSIPPQSIHFESPFSKGSQTIPCQSIPPEGPIIDLCIIDHKIDLSLSNIIDLFYKSIGQTKISKAKRERATKCFEELILDGFTNDDIQFAIEWSLTNMKEKPYDFSIIKDTISQAMAQKDKIQKEQKLQIEKEISKTQKEEQEKEEAIERENIITIKQNLNPTERSELRNGALELIKNTEGIKEHLITEVLVEAKENEILRLRLKK
jgi:hypothetical protein